jgi:hypothetical protein
MFELLTISHGLLTSMRKRMMSPTLTLECLTQKMMDPLTWMIVATILKR